MKKSNAVLKNNNTISTYSFIKPMFRLYLLNCLTYRLPKNINMSFKKRYRSDGRIGRTKYWVVNIVFMFIFYLISPYQHSDPSWAFWLFALPMIVYSLHISIQRAHDRNRSFLFVLLLFVPFICIWPMIELGFFPRVDKNNAYGTRAH